MFLNISRSVAGKYAKFKVAFTAIGGTGHVYPAVALAQEISKEASNDNVCFIVSGKRQDKTILDSLFTSFSCASTRKNPYAIKGGLSGTADIKT